MNLTKRTSTRFPEKLDFADGDKIRSHDGHLQGRQRRNFVGELGGATCTTSCLLTHHSLGHANVREAWSGYLGFFFFPWLPRMAEALQSKTQGKKELVERNSVDLALAVRGCTKGVQRSIEKRLQHSDEPRSLSFQFPCYSFLELSLRLQFTFLCLSFSISFCTHLQPSGRLKNLMISCLVSSTKLDVNATT